MGNSYCIILILFILVAAISLTCIPQIKNESPPIGKIGKGRSNNYSKDMMMKKYSTDMTIDDLNYEIEELTKKLHRENARYETGQKIYLLEKHDSYFSYLDRMMVHMAGITSDDKPDQVYIRLKPTDDYIFKELRKKTFLFSEDEINRLVNQIVIHVNDFIDQKEFPDVDFGIRVDDDGKNATFYCGRIVRRYCPDIYAFLYNKIKHVKSKEIQDLLVLNMIVRHESLINRYQNWNLSTEFYRMLKDKHGFRGEAFSSPLNARLCLLEFLDGKGKEECWFYSLFPDTDAVFGSRGNVFLADPEDLCNIIFAYVKTDKLDKIVPELCNKAYAANKDCKMIIRGGGLIEGFDKFKVKELTPNEVLYEDNNKYEKPIWFTFNGDAIYYNFDLSQDDFDKLKPPPKFKENTQAEVNKLTNEFHRYIYVQKIINLQNLFGKLKYEWENILERFLLSMANIAYTTNKFEDGSDDGIHNITSNYKDKKKIDQIFIELPSSHYIYKKLESEMREKRIRDNGIVNKIRALISEFLSTEYNKYIKFTRQYGRVHVSDGITTISKDMDVIRYNTLHSKLLLNTDSMIDYDLYIVILVVRHECILAKSQQWNIPFAYYENLYLNYGLKLEGFASPLNAQTVVLDYLTGAGNFDTDNVGYCSLFYDIDKYFGSRGNIFNFDIDKHYDDLVINKKGDEYYTVCLNPPFIESMFLQMCDLIDKWMKSDKKIRVFTGCPTWSDAEFFMRLKSMPQLKYTKDLKYGEFYYEDSQKTSINRIKVRSGYSTFVISNFDKPKDEPQYENASRFLNAIKY